ncbi:MAG: ferrochelatase [Bacteroidetes bacterium]|nr:ferrochelatase [Bacteroidota bacterium]
MKTGILLVNLGTPDSYSTPDVRKYLREFLSDPRVIDINPVGRWMLVNLIIAPFRSPKSAKLYKHIWTENGSPLLHLSNRQKQLLQEKLGNGYQVELAMRYGNPGIGKVMNDFAKQDLKKIIVLPLFPQYASATTGSVHEKIMSVIQHWQVIPEIKFINSYCNDTGFIHAFTEAGRKHHPKNFDHVLFSFHGLPERQITKADTFDHCLKDNCCASLGEKNNYCYRAQCFETARLLAAGLQLPFEKYTVCFQSRLGRAEWIKPYASETIIHRAAKGDKKILVFAPAFTSDCLETIYEIGMEYDHLFKQHGGEKIQLVESLNDQPSWIEAMAGIISAN